MSAAVVPHVPTVPRGATAIERWGIRVAAYAMRRLTRRAERRQERHDAMLARIEAEQTARPDARAIDYALAQNGLRLK